MRSHPSRRVALVATWLVLGATVWAFVPVPGTALTTIPPELDRAHETGSPAVTPAQAAASSRSDVDATPALPALAPVALPLAGLTIATLLVLLLRTDRAHGPPAFRRDARRRRRGPPALLASSGAG